MNPHLKRVLIFAGTSLAALGSSISTMPDGGTMTFATIGNIPVMAVFLSLGAGIGAALGVTKSINEKVK